MACLSQPLQGAGRFDRGGPLLCGLGSGLALNVTPNVTGTGVGASEMASASQSSLLADHSIVPLVYLSDGP